jgi:fructose-1,6-bisphosphatase-3
MITEDLPFLEALARRFPHRDAALAEIAHLQAVLTLPRGTIHVVSDVHGEHKKLSHVIRNASGSLRVLVDRVFADLDDAGRRELLNIVYYCEQTWAHKGLDRCPVDVRDAFFFAMLDRLLTLARALSSTWSDRAVERVFPPAYKELFRELFLLNAGARVDVDGRYRRALVQPFLRRDGGRDLLRLLSRLVRNLSVFELVVAGDLGDRGPRLDRVIDVLAKQPRLSITWGNHDVSWMGACLGHEALVATVVRLSLRYARTQQLEEGYGISLEPVEALVRAAYADDPATTWQAKSPVNGRDALLVARMQKAMAILQFKLEGQCVARHPQWQMDDRRLLRSIDFSRRVVVVDGREHALVDAHLPTVDPAAPERLSPDEQRCIDALRASFVASQALWRQMQFVRARGAMHVCRDHHLIFHGCVPVDDDGVPLSFVVDGEAVAGRALFARCERVVHRAFREKRTEDLDLLWYLWTGPRSPLFGKDKMATFEIHFVADESARHETKNAYFKLVHDAAFCDRIFADFDVDPAVGLIVNGHVPVKLESGETPLKKSGLAITIDGAFSEAYGDKGFTLILEASRTALAEHHHFESVDDAVKIGADIVPRVTDLRTYASPRRVEQTEAGARIAREIEALQALVQAFEDNRIAEGGTVG